MNRIEEVNSLIKKLESFIISQFDYTFLKNKPSFLRDDFFKNQRYINIQNEIKVTFSNIEVGSYLIESIDTLINNLKIELIDKLEINESIPKDIKDIFNSYYKEVKNDLLESKKRLNEELDKDPNLDYTPNETCLSLKQTALLMKYLKEFKIIPERVPDKEYAKAFSSITPLDYRKLYDLLTFKKRFDILTQTKKYEDLKAILKSIITAIDHDIKMLDPDRI